MNSHIQTRILTDALNKVDDVLKTRNTSLIYSADQEQLGSYFAQKAYPKYFDSWAFTAAEFSATVEKIAQITPHLVPQLEEPTSPYDFTIIGNCSLDLIFNFDNAYERSLQLCNGKWVKFAQVDSYGKVYSNRLIAIQTSIPSEKVYFYCPETEPQLSAASLAQQVFANRDDAIDTEISLKFPMAQTTHLVDYPWVKDLKSKCGLYEVRNHLYSGKAVVNQYGFFAQEIHVVDMMCLSFMEYEKVIDRPFLIFFANEDGIHAAVWFSWDSFTEIT